MTSTGVYMIETWLVGQHRKSKRLAPNLLLPFENFLNKKSSIKIYFASAIYKKCWPNAKKYFFQAQKD